jgi:PEP-CTERM motif
MVNELQTGRPGNPFWTGKKIKFIGTFSPPVHHNLTGDNSFAPKRNQKMKGYVMNKPKLTSIRFALAVVTMLAASAVCGRAQGELASGTVSGVQSGGNYDYTIMLNNTSDSVAIGSFWYAWVPGAFYLPSDPTGASAPAGWTASIVLNSIQFSANSGISLAPGASISFQYVGTFAPSQLTGTAGNSFVYTGGIEDDPGAFLDVQTVAPAPEPSTFGLLAVGSLGLLAGGWRKLRAQ